MNQLEVCKEEFDQKQRRLCHLQVTTVKTTLTKMAHND